jgi:ribosome recycling factor
LRNARHEARETAEKLKKDRSISDDDFSRFEKQLDEALQKTKTEVESQTKAKETEIMTL